MNAAEMNERDLAAKWESLAQTIGRPLSEGRHLAWYQGEWRWSDRKNPTTDDHYSHFPMDRSAARAMWRDHAFRWLGMRDGSAVRYWHCGDGHWHVEGHGYAVEYLECGDGLDHALAAACAEVGRKAEP